MCDYILTPTDSMGRFQPIIGLYSLSNDNDHHLTGSILDSSCSYDSNPLFLFIYFFSSAGQLYSWPLLYLCSFTIIISVIYSTKKRDTLLSIDLPEMRDKTRDIAQNSFSSLYIGTLKNMNMYIVWVMAIKNCGGCCLCSAFMIQTLGNKS